MPERMATQLNCTSTWAGQDPRLERNLYYRTDVSVGTTNTPNSQERWTVVAITLTKYEGFIYNGKGWWRQGENIDNNTTSVG